MTNARAPRPISAQKDTRKLFSQWPEALQATVEIAEKCNLQLPVGRLNFPTFETKDGKTNARLLYELSSAGLARRYARITGEADLAAGVRAQRHRARRLCRLFPDRERHHRLLQVRTYPGSWARLGGIVDCLVLPGDHRGLPDRAGPVFPALPQRGPPRSARCRSRSLLETPR